MGVSRILNRCAIRIVSSTALLPHFAFGSGLPAKASSNARTVPAQTMESAFSRVSRSLFRGNGRTKNATSGFFATILFAVWSSFAQWGQFGSSKTMILRFASFLPITIAPESGICETSTRFIERIRKNY